MSRPDNYWTEQNQKAEMIGGAVATGGCLLLLAFIALLLIVGALL